MAAAAAGPPMNMMDHFFRIVTSICTSVGFLRRSTTPIRYTDSRFGGENFHAHGGITDYTARCDDLARVVELVQSRPDLIAQSEEENRKMCTKMATLVLCVENRFDAEVARAHFLSTVKWSNQDDWLHWVLSLNDACEDAEGDYSALSDHLLPFLPQ